MPLETSAPKFDRPFEELYRELRSRIPFYNPDWTNFNDSDPGITLLQLFAWMAEMTLHRMGQVPRNNYLKFAELLGLQLRAAQPARVQLTFMPKPAEPPSTIPARSRYSAQADGNSVVFETTQDLDVIGAPLKAMVVYSDGGPVKIEIPQAPPGQAFYPLGRNPRPGDALYLGFARNANIPRPFPSRMRFLALRPAADTSGPPQRVGEQNRNLVPPVDLVWEYRPRAGQDAWERLNVFDDGTVAFTRDGYVDVEGPQGIEESEDETVKLVVPDKLYWLRVRLDENTYPTGRAPRLEYFLPNSVDAVNLSSEGEQTGRLGPSNGRAEQYFNFPNRPVDPDSLKLEVRVGDVRKEWTRVDDFFSSGSDEVFVLDATAGRVTFGDGTQGRIPPAGADIVATVWRTGGGAAGNKVGPGAVKTMVTQIAGIEKVTNFRPATGGANEEDVEGFIKGVPARLLSRDRAVTERDFESLATSIDGVMKARALGGRHPDFPGAQVPGAVTVFVVPDSDERRPEPSAELIRSVCLVFERARLITTEVFAAAPRFIEVRVEGRLLAAPEAAFDKVAAEARKRLDDFLSPRNRQFGEDVSAAAILAELFGRPGAETHVRSVGELLIYVDGRQHDSRKPVVVPADAIVFPGSHLIVVRPDRDEGGAR